MKRALIVALALLGFVVGAYGISEYEAWWTFSFIIFGLVIVILEVWRPRGAATIGIAAGIAGSLLLGGMGVFFAVMSRGGDFFVGGIAAIAIAFVGLGATAWFVRRRDTSNR